MQRQTLDSVGTNSPGRSRVSASGVEHVLAMHSGGPISDQRLVARCRLGDARAWDRLVERYERLIFSVARRNGLDREDAADITQTTFLALLDSLDSLRDDERLPSWLMTVARRQAWRLRKRRECEQPRGQTVLTQVDPIPDWERNAVLHEALATLGSPCRDLLTALYFDQTDPSYAVVARRLGRAVGTLGAMRSRCLQRMRTLVGEDIFS